MTTLAMSLRCLETNHISFETIHAGGCTFVISEYGGRILGPFLPDGSCMTWLCSQFDRQDDFKDLQCHREWNIGGERVLIAPELAYFSHDSSDFRNTMFVPDQIDPGYHLVRNCGTFVSIEQQLSLTANQNGIPYQKRCAINRTVRAVDDPLNSIADAENIARLYCGIEHSVTLEDFTNQIPIALEPWMIMQVRPGGCAFIPYNTASGRIDYYGPAEESFYSEEQGVAKIFLNGKHLYKAGFLAATTRGITVYLREQTDERVELIIRNYYNDPSNPYSCAPWHSQQKKGCSLFYYNDDGNLGGFAEMENSGLTIIPNSKNTRSDNKLCTWYYVCNRTDAERITGFLLGEPVCVAVSSSWPKLSHDKRKK